MENVFGKILFSFLLFDIISFRFDPDGFHSVDLDRIIHCLKNDSYPDESQRNPLRSETQDQQKAILQRGKYSSDPSRSSSLSMKTPRLTS